MAKRWYALRSKPRKEPIVWRKVLSKGMECFYPRIRVHPVNPRSRKVKPYFPGYLFIRVDLENVGISTFKWMPHTLGLVTFGGEAAYIPDSLIQALKRQVVSINEAGGEIFDGLKRGDKVKIIEGPFSGYEAIFDHRLSGKERVRVLLKFLNSDRRVPVELDVSHIDRE
ncbi:MAG: transcription termination/antitermination NusG family protein [Anaerolineales bacterium]